MPWRWFRYYVYRNYRVSSSFRHRLRRRFTRAGFLVLTFWGISAGVGVDTNQSMAYQAFVVLTLLLVISMTWALLPVPRFRMERILPRYGSVGQPLNYSIWIENLSGRSQQGLLLSERLADPRPTFDEFYRIPEPGERQRNWFDRFFGFYRWRWLTERNKVAKAKESWAPLLPRKQRVEVPSSLLPLKRGQLRLMGLEIGCPDPFGLVKSFRQVEAPASVLILPKRYPLPAFALPGIMRYQPGGVALASSVGESEEFVSLREYRPGDSLRHIHWKSWAKTGQPIVKEFEDEYFVRHALILDTFGEQEEEANFEEAVSVAASFACTVQTQESLLDLLFVGPKAFCFTAGRGLAHPEQMLEILASVQQCTTMPFASLSDLILEHMSAVSGCICVFLRWDAPRQELVRKLKMFDAPMLILAFKNKKDKGCAETPSDLPPVHWLEAGKVEEGLNRL